MQNNVEIDSSIQTLAELIALPTVSHSNNAEISANIAARLEAMGFTVEVSTYRDPSGVEKTNLVGCRPPKDSNASSQSEHATDQQTARQGVAYFCHTDVVPVDQWTGPGDAFASVVKDRRIYGRGACDMKGSLVAMLGAIERVEPESQTAPIWFVCTADEEVAFQGAKQLVKSSAAYRQIVNAQPLAIIGEPTSLEIVHAHKGITGFEVTSIGRAAHSSTTDGINANIAIVPLLNKLCDIERRTREEPRYQDERFDPPILSWNFGVNDSCDAINITPSRCRAWVTLRTMPGIDGEDLIAEAAAVANDCGLEFKRYNGGDPVWVEADRPAVQAMAKLAESQPRTVCYGTDGGEFRELADMVVCGPGSIQQAHTSDEFIAIDQLAKGIDLFERTLRHFA